MTMPQVKNVNNMFTIKRATSMGITHNNNRESEKIKVMGQLSCTNHHMGMDPCITQPDEVKVTYHSRLVVSLGIEIK